MTAREMEQSYLAYLRQTVGAVGFLLPSHCEHLFTEVERLQDVVDAARRMERTGDTLITLSHHSARCGRWTTISGECSCGHDSAAGCFALAAMDFRKALAALDARPAGADRKEQ